jgi:predicted GNAT superfamily acetyltransferase
MTGVVQAAAPASAVALGAWRAATAAAEASSVQIRDVEDLQTSIAISRLFSAIWNRDPGSPQMTPELLRALAMTGNYVVGAFAGDELVGAAVAFFASSPLARLHSHITGVAVSRQAQGIGYALKLHQRAWSLERGVWTITWTFDPLVRRNAHFNLARLGARVIEYLPNFYGDMQDGVNGGDQSDRVLVEWDLTAPEVASCCGGAPVVPAGSGACFTIAVPPDIERLRLEAPDVALKWRLALRERLSTAVADGAVVGFRKDDGYVVETSRPA